MADFSIQSTELSAPKGAGSSPIAPSTAGVFDNGVGEAIGNVISIFGKGLQDSKKAEQEALRKAILLDYSQRQQNINSGYVTGGIAPDKAARESRMLYGKFIAQYPEFEKELTSVNSAFRVGGVLSEVEDVEKTRKDERNTLIRAARSAGFPVSSDQAVDVQDSFLRTYQLEEAVYTKFTRGEARKEALRKAGRYDKELEDARAKSDSEKTLAEIGRSNLESFFALGSHYAKKVKEGMPSQDAALAITQHSSRILQQINLVGGSHPELASAYRTMFSDASKNILDSFDQKKALEDLEADKKKILLNSELRMLGNQRAADAVAISNLFGNNPTVTLRIMQTTGGLIDKFLNDNTKVVPTVTGTPNDAPVLQGLKENLKAYSTGTAKNPSGTKDETVTYIRNYLKQLGALQGQGVSAKDLQEAADVFASSDYGKFMSENPINPQEMRPASQLFEMTYEKEIVTGVSKVLEKSVVVNTGLVPNRAATGATLSPKTEKLPIDVFDAKFNGVSLEFVMKKPPKGAVGEASYAANTELNTAAKAITKLIRIGAHNEGTTDYANYWEKRKHILLPQLYPIPVGTVINGATYKGGDWRDKNNYTLPAGAKDE